MKLLERLIENALDRSPLMFKVADTISAFTDELNKLGTAVALLAHTIQSHRDAIVELNRRQNQLVALMQSGSIDTQMPEIIDGKTEKPN